jgi:transposase
MSTSLLYHGFGRRGYQHVCNRYYEGAIDFHVRQDRFSRRGPACRSYKVRRKGVVLRRFRTVPISLKPVWIVLPVQRLLCRLCGALRQVKVDFAQERRSYTHVLERGVLELSRHMTIRDVSRFLKVSRDVVKDFQKRNLNQRFANPKLKKLKQIAIDEISIGKGHRYLTIVPDLKSGALVFVEDGKGADASEPFWQRLRRSGGKIEAVATDMSPAYINAVLPTCQRLPWSLITFTLSSSTMTNCPARDANFIMKPPTCFRNR